VFFGANFTKTNPLLGIRQDGRARKLFKIQSLRLKVQDLCERLLRALKVKLKAWSSAMSEV